MNVKECPEILEVTPLGNLNLLVGFKNGIRKRLDINPYLGKFSVFQKLEDRKVFENVKVDSSGCGIVWNAEIDLSACDAWEFGVEY
jgi:hypothetical protein